MSHLQSEHTDIARLRDELTGCLIGLARAADGSEHLITESTTEIIVDGLSVKDDSDRAALETLLERAKNEKRKMVPNCFSCAYPCGRTSDYDMANLWNADRDIRSLKSLILFGIRSIAAGAHRDDTIRALLYKALFAIGMDDWGTEELMPIVLEVGEAIVKCKK